MNSLLAIVLVVNSTRGHHFMFSYPRNPQRPESYYEDLGATTLYSKNKSNTSTTTTNNNNNNNTTMATTFKKQAESSTSTSTTTTDRLPPNASQSLRKSNDVVNLDQQQQQQQQQSQQQQQQQQNKEDVFAGRDSIFDIEVSFLADALAPRLELCDRKFQLSVDDLTFVGHPVSLASMQEETDEDDDGQEEEEEEEEETDAETTDEEDDCDDNNNDNNNDNSIGDNTNNNNNNSSNKETTNTSTGGMDGDHNLDNNDNNTNNQTDSNHNNNENTNNNVTPTTAKLKKKQQTNEDKDKNKSNNNKNNGTTHMTLFHVVFIMSPPDLELNARTDMIYSHVIRRYAAALQYEQLRCGYIQDEFEKILAIRDDAMNKGTPYEQVMQTILLESSLARDIKQIYSAISTNNIAHIIINDFIDLSLQIPVFGETAGVTPADAGMGLPLARTQDYYYASLMDIYGMSGYEYDNYPVICPYHTLLLLEDPEEVLKNMPLDASPTLVQLVQILTPTQR